MAERTIIETGDFLSKINKSIPERISDFSDYSFRYYTTQKTLKSILNRDGAFFYISNYSEMNDLDEATLHSKEKDKIHALCFSNTDNESIPMWYLYSGLLGKGACLRFTPGLMKEFIQSIDVVYPVKSDMTVDLSTKLHIGKDFEIKHGWVCYYENKKNFFYRNEWYRINNDVDDFFRNNYFLKRYPWYYEREYRIVIINKTQNVYKKLAIPFRDNVLSSKKLSIILAPESLSTDENIWVERGFITKKSDMNISMSLLARNRDEIYSYISDAIEYYSKSIKSSMGFD